jgi:1-aminocyclopropane-1-carboxylate deaminase
MPWWESHGPHAHSILLKREDEVRFGMTGGKLRKYASILPWLKKKDVRTVALIGSANSNQMLSAAMLLAENRIEAIPFLKKGHHKGTNQFLLSLIVPKAKWQLLESDAWPHVEEIAAAFIARKPRSVFLTEGACVREALPGAMTLAADILRNEKENFGSFVDIFIDAGTGLSATALLLGMHDLGMKARLHITLMADSEEKFLMRWKQYVGWYEELFGRSIPPELQERMVLHRPAFGRSYGSVNAEVITTIQRYAEMGILTDPIYSAKHLATVERYFDEIGKSSGPMLVIHSGGAQALPGYEHLFEG